MLQTVGNRNNVFVVDFVTMPTLPITWNTPQEEPYAKALQNAIVTKKITEPGKYGIVIETITGSLDYTIYTINE